MYSKSLIVTLAASSVLLAGNVLAGEIYKYTDEDGTVSYVDRPTTDPNGVQMDIRSRPTDNAAVQAYTRARLAAANVAASEQTKQNEAEGGEKLTRSERHAASAAQQQQCETYRAQLDTIDGPSRLFRPDENGEPIYMTDDESQAAKDQVRGLIRLYCS